MAIATCRIGLAGLLLMLIDSESFSQTFIQDANHITSGIQLERLESQTLGLAEKGAPRRLHPLAQEIIKDFEGWRPDAYNDASWFCTIGYGHLIARKPCEDSTRDLAVHSPPLTIERGLILLEEDTTIARQVIRRLVKQPVTDEQFGALTSFVFNVGGRNFSQSRMLGLINAGEYVAAGKQFARWIMSRGKVLDGLVSRRKCEAALYMGKLTRENGAFERRQCVSLGAAPAVDTFVDVEFGE